MGELLAEKQRLKFGGHDGKAECYDAFSSNHTCNGGSTFTTRGWERTGRLGMIDLGKFVYNSTCFGWEW